MKILNENLLKLDEIQNLASATSMTSERGKGMFLKIIFLKLVHSSKKDELCSGFEVNILTKSVHRGGVRAS